MNNIDKYYKKFLIWKTKNLASNQILLGAALFIGIFSGIAAVIIKNLVNFTYNLITSTSYGTPDRANLLYLAYPMIGIALTVIIVKFIVKDDLSHGVSKVMYALSKGRGKIKFHNTWSSMLTSSLTVAFGGSVGLEAPMVYTGSAIGANIARFFRLNTHYTSILISCGAAGAIAGVFNAPIAGILFAFEILMLDMSMVALLPMLVSSIMASIVAYYFLGDLTPLSFHAIKPFELEKIPAFIVLGLISAFACLYFRKVDDWIGRMFSHLNTFWKIIIGGLLLGGLVYVFPPLFGEGYNSLHSLMQGKMNLLLENSFFYGKANNVYFLMIITLSIILLKAFATNITCASGGVGGVFAPSLFIGGFVGFLVALGVNLISPVQVDYGNFVLVGMSSVMAGMMFAPLTSIFLITEVTGGYELMVPLLISTTISYLVSKSFTKYSIYAAPLAKDGYALTHNKDKIALMGIDKEKLLERNFYRLDISATLRDVVVAVENSSRSMFPVVDKDNNFKGMLVLDDVRKMLFHEEYYDKVYVKDKMRYSNYFIADINDSLQTIIRKFHGVDRYTIVIVDKGKFLGCMSRANVFAAYQKYIHNNSDDD